MDAKLEALSRQFGKKRGEQWRKSSCGQTVRKRGKAPKGGLERTGRVYWGRRSKKNADKTMWGLSETVKRKESALEEDESHRSINCRSL